MGTTTTEASLGDGNHPRPRLRP